MRTLPAASTSELAASAIPVVPSFLAPLWLDVLPADLAERTARFVSRGNRTEALLHLAQTSPRQHLAAVAALDYKLNLHSHQGSGSIEEWARIFVDHVRELEFECSKVPFSLELLGNLMLGSQLRRLVLKLDFDELVAETLFRRSWDGVDVHIEVEAGVVGTVCALPLHQFLWKMGVTNLRPRKMTIGSEWEPNCGTVCVEKNWSSEERLFDVLKDVSEVRVPVHSGNANWMAMLSRLPGRTSLEMDRAPPSDLLPSIQRIDEICIKPPSDIDAMRGTLSDFAVLGTAVVELDLETVWGDGFLESHHLASLANWFPNLRRLDVGLKAGCETSLPCVLSKLPKLDILSLRWNLEPEVADVNRYYRPVPGAIGEGIERCAGLSRVCLLDVELDAQELGRILRHLGERLRGFHVTLDRGPEPLERAIAVAVAAAQYCPSLRWLSTQLERNRMWGIKYGVAKCGLAAAGGLLEKRCVYLEQGPLAAFYA